MYKNEEDKIAYAKKYYQEHREESLKKTREWKRNNRERNRFLSRRSYRRARNLFIEMYGGKCICCGESIVEFLSLHHVKGQIGKKKQSARAAYSEASKKYSPEKFEILCHNCNQAIGYSGYCPHERRQRNV